MTKRQAQLLAFIKLYVEKRGFSPSLDEMRAALGLRAKSGAHRIVEALVDAGFLDRVPNRYRSIVVIDGARRPVPTDMLTPELKEYCRAVRRPIGEVIRDAVREYIAAHPSQGEAP